MSKREINRTECCNLLKLKKHGQKTKSLLHVSVINMKKLHSLGHTNVTREHFLCPACTTHLFRKVSIETTDQEEAEIVQEELLTEHHDVSLTSDNIPSDSEMDIDYEPNTDCEPELNKQSEAEKTLEEILLNLKELIAQSKDNDIKVLLLKALPKDWSQEHIVENYGCTEYMVRKSRNLSSTCTAKRGRPTINPNVISKVIDFYLDDSVSRPFPGMKDTISVKESNGKRDNKQKRLLLRTIEDLYNEFIPTCDPEEKISLSSFMRLRPKECVFATDSAAHNVCVCAIHQNTELMVDALRKTKAFDEVLDGVDGGLLQLLSKKMVCDHSSESCLLRECVLCNIKNCNKDKTKPEEMVEFITTILDEHNIDSVIYNMWLTSPECDFIETTENVDNFADRLKKQMEKYIPHELKREKQFAFIKNIKKN